MSRRAILIVIWVVMLIGVVGVSYVGYRYFTRNRVAVGTYRLPNPQDLPMSEQIRLEKALMTQEELLRGVINDLDLTAHWSHASEEESLAHMRKSLILQEGGEKDMLRVIYLDRNQEMALTILKAISDRYVVVKKQADQQRLLYGPVN